MIQAWRIVKAKHQKHALTDLGCQYASGRWNHLMVSIVYCSDSQALAALETFVHLQDDAKQIKYISIELQIPIELIQNVETITTIAKRWRAQPPNTDTKTIGSDWVESNSSAVLSVPSAIATAGRNILLNPQHVDFNKILLKKSERFSFDARLWK